MRKKVNLKHFGRTAEEDYEEMGKQTPSQAQYVQEQEEQYYQVDEVVQEEEEYHKNHLLMSGMKTLGLRRTRHKPKMEVNTTKKKYIRKTETITMMGESPLFVTSIHTRGDK